MIKYLLILLLVAESYSYTFLTLVDCQIELGGWRGVYKSTAGEYYELKFRDYCPSYYEIR